MSCFAPLVPLPRVPSLAGLVASVALLACPPEGAAQEESGEPGDPDRTAADPAGPPLVTRYTLENFLVDEIALTPFLRDGSAPAPLESTYTIDSPDGTWRAIWDPTACRLAGVLRLTPPEETEEPSAQSDQPTAETGESTGDPPPNVPPAPFVLLAMGTPPLTATPAATGASSFFGFRLVEGLPEFLYTQGSVAVEERLWFDTSGRLQQRWRLRNIGGDVSLQFPPHWRARSQAERGEWKQATLTLTGGEGSEEEKTTGEFVVHLAYTLDDNP